MHTAVPLPIPCHLCVVISPTSIHPPSSGLPPLSSAPYSPSSGPCSPSPTFHSPPPHPHHLSPSTPDSSTRPPYPLPSTLLPSPPIHPSNFPSSNCLLVHSSLTCLTCPPVHHFPAPVPQLPASRADQGQTDESALRWAGSKWEEIAWSLGALSCCDTEDMSLRGHVL